MRFGFAFPWSQLGVWGLTALLALAALVLALRRLERRRVARMHAFVHGALVSRLLVGYDARARRPLFWLTLVGFAALLLAFAQPHWGQAWKELRKQSRDIFICLDTSESMRATDHLPNRLERSKQKIVSLVDRCPGDRFGLIAFAGASALQCPLTLDHAYFKAVLHAVDTNTISLKGTNIASAIEESVQVFRDEDAERDEFNRDTRAILLISDGEQVSGDAIAAAELASDYCRVYVMGVGDPDGAEIAIPDIVRNAARGAGRPMRHLSKLDQDTLIKIAQAGGGPYVNATIDNWDIDQIHQAMERLHSRIVASDMRLQLVNRYQWPLALAVVCFMAEGLWLAALPWIRAWRMARRRSAPEEAPHA